MKTDVISISEFSTIGVYTLRLHVSKEVTLTVGKLEKQVFSEGYYAYTGSALGNGATSLKHRLARHLKKQKFWHINYLLANQNVSIGTAIAAETTKKMECTINGYLKDLKGAKVPINRFVASDCRKNCKIHLLYFTELKKADCLVQKLVLPLQSSIDILSVIVVD